MAWAAVQKKVTAGGFQGANSATTTALDSTPTAGNIGVMFVYMQDGDASARTVTPPTGWTQITGLSGGNNVDAHIAAFVKEFGVGESTSWTWTWTNPGSFNQGALVIEYSGGDTSTPIDVSGGATHYDSVFNTAWSEASITTVTAGALDLIFVNTKSQGPGFTGPAGYTEECDEPWGAVYSQTLGAAGATGARTGTNPSWSKVTLSFALRPASGATREQEGYRWRADDGSESAATWLASQDTNISRAKLTTTRLRILTNVTNDAPSEALKLQYRKVGDPAWRDVS